MFSAYSAANSFLDACTLDQRYRAGRRAYCFNWTMWDDLGMSRGAPAFAREATRAAGFHILSPERGFHSLLAGLERGGAQLVVGLDGDDHHLRPRILADSYPREELTAFFTGPAEIGRLQELAPRDRFGLRSACKLRRLAGMPRTAGGELPTEAELLYHLRDRLPSYKIPARFAFVDSLPRTPTMKPQRQGLLELFEGRS